MADGVGPQHGRGAGGRPGWLLPAALAVAVVAVAAVVVVVVLSRPDGGTAAGAQPTTVVTTVVRPLPTPDVQPSARATGTAFTAALPGAVLQYAYRSSQPEPQWLAAGALEAWADTYADGAAGTLTVQAGQFPTAAEATAFAATLTAALPTTVPSATATGAPALPATGQVAVGGTVSGSYTVVDGGNGTGIAVWTNGTGVFRLVAPLADVLNAYRSFPL
jgi:hypothetical protein